MKFLNHSISMADTRRRYRRGYYYGRRNRALSLCPHQNSAAFCRGWGAGQTWLHIKIGAWPKDC